MYEITKPVVVAEPSLEGFAEWLATKDPNETYDWMPMKRCAIGQYLLAIGYCKLNKDGDLDRPPPSDLYARLEGGLCDVAQGYPRTFGAALERARAALGRKGKR